MAEKLNYDPELCEKLIPKWEVGCRRVTPGPGYLEAFSRPNCNLSNSPITKITENAVHTEDGKVFECDVGKFNQIKTLLAILLNMFSHLRHWFRRLSSSSLSHSWPEWGQPCR